MSDFNFDELAAEFASGQREDPLSNMQRIPEMSIDDNDSIRQRINSRRLIMQEQLRADELKSKLCDEIQTEKAKVVGLKEKIAALEESDPEFFKYIRKLEFIQDGIWCPRCNIQKVVNVHNGDKTIGFAPSSTQDVDALHAYEAAYLGRCRAEYDQFEHRMVQIIEAATRIKSEYTDRISEMIMQVSSIEQELTQLQARARVFGGEIGHSPNIASSATTHVPHKNTAPVKTSGGKDNLLQNYTMSLPPHPTFDIDKLIEKTFGSALCADDLLAD